jgi:hypothetical protein
MNIEWVTLHGIAKITWYEAMNLDKKLGRLPNINELLDAYKNKVSGFENTYYWSSDDYGASTDQAIIFHFGTGQISTSFKNNVGHISSRFCKDLKG